MRNKKKEKVVFYLDSDTKKLVSEKCQLHQIKMSFFIRNSVLESLGKTTIQSKITDVDTTKYLSSLFKIGNNLNQIAKQLNSGNKFQIADQKDVLNDIENIKKHILEINNKLLNDGK